MNIKRPTFPLPSSLPAVPSPHFSELFSQNPEIPYLQKATPPNSLQTKVVPHCRFTLFLWGLAAGRRLSASELLRPRLSRDERLVAVAGRPARGCPGPRYLRALVLLRWESRGDALGRRESASVHRKDWKITPTLSYSTSPTPCTGVKHPGKIKGKRQWRFILVHFSSPFRFQQNWEQGRRRNRDLRGGKDLVCVCVCVCVYR